MAIHTEPGNRELASGIRLPVTEAAARHTLLLPIYASMTDAEQAYVIEHLLEALQPGPTAASSRPGRASNADSHPRSVNGHPGGQR
jgi:hypothetical protein